MDENPYQSPAAEVIPPNDDWLPTEGVADRIGPFFLSSLVGAMVGLVFTPSCGGDLRYVIGMPVAGAILGVAACAISGSLIGAILNRLIRSR